MKEKKLGGTGEGTLGRCGGAAGRRAPWRAGARGRRTGARGRRVDGHLPGERLQPRLLHEQLRTRRGGGCGARGRGRGWCRPCGAAPARVGWGRRGGWGEGGGGGADWERTERNWREGEGRRGTGEGEGGISYRGKLTNGAPRSGAPLECFFT